MERKETHYCCLLSIGTYVCHSCTLHRDLTLVMPVPNPTTHAVPPLLPQCRPLFAACATAGPGPKCCARLWCQPLVAGRLAGACRQVKSQRGRHGAAGTFTCESAPSGSFCNRHTMQRLMHGCLRFHCAVPRGWRCLLRVPGVLPTACLPAAAHGGGPSPEGVPAGEGSLHARHRHMVWDFRPGRMCPAASRTICYWASSRLKHGLAA